MSKTARTVSAAALAIVALVVAAPSLKRRARTDKITHIVNGRAVMRAWDVKQTSLTDPATYLPELSGRIMLQAEGAEVWFRNVQMKPLPPIKE